MYGTDHLPLAAYLATAGYQPSPVRHMSSKRVVFEFTGDAQLKEHVDKFFTGNALVDPAEFEQNRIVLRRQIERLTREES